MRRKPLFPPPLHPCSGKNLRNKGRQEYSVGTINGRVADAINEAPPGQVIAGSEEPVRDLFADLRREAYEMAVQMRVDAAEAAFPPSEGRGHGPDQAQ